MWLNSMCKYSVCVHMRGFTHVCAICWQRNPVIQNESTQTVSHVWVTSSLGRPLQSVAIHQPQLQCYSTDAVTGIKLTVSFLNARTWGVLVSEVWMDLRGIWCEEGWQQWSKETNKQKKRWSLPMLVGMKAFMDLRSIGPRCSEFHWRHNPAHHSPARQSG